MRETAKMDSPDSSKSLCEMTYQEFRSSYVASKPPAEYEWVQAVAISQFGFVERAIKELDDKASSIVGYLGGATGLISVSLAALKVELLVLCSAVPSIALAVASVWFAIHCRRTTIVGHPAIQMAVQYVEQLGESSKASYLADWNYFIGENTEVASNKADLLDRSLSLFWWAILLLLLPVAMNILIVGTKS